MSLILDALKKLEQEKATRLGRKVDLRPAVTGRKSAPPPPPWRLPLLFLGAITLAVGATLGVMGRLSSKPAPVAPPQVQARAESPPPPEPSLPSPLPMAAAVPELPADPPLRAPAKRPPPELKRTRSALKETTTPPPADFQVTGIAWLEEHGARRAVVNGALLGEGALVAGATITEIRQDQIRFTRNGQSFTVYIASSNR